MKKISIKSPTRVDLAGGTLDLWPLYNFIDGAVTVNTAINIFTQVNLNERNDKKISIHSRDLDFHEEYEDLQAVLSSQDPRLLLFKSQFKFWNPQVGFDIYTQSDSPVGGGLGGSSSLTISMMKSFENFLGKKSSSIHQRVHCSHNIESEVLNTPTGTQDYYPADSGGLNILTYSAEGIHQEVYPIEGTPLDDHFLLVYTGKSHHSGLNNFEVMKAAVAKDFKVISALRELKIVAEKMKETMLRKRWGDIPELFRQEYSARIRLAPAFTCPEIEQLEKISLANGADAVKICGAGGGGCVLIWCPPNNRQKVIDVCQKNGFQPMEAKPINPL